MAIEQLTPPGINAEPSPTPPPAPVECDGGFLEPNDFTLLDVSASAERRFSFDYLLRRKKPFIHFPRYRDPLGEPGLPPQDVWLADPRKDRFETPIDERGLIDHHAMILAVNDTIDPEYEWPIQLSLDHFYWPAPWYEAESVDPVAARFRQLSIHKGIVPRQWENWKHAITQPAPLPSAEVMHYRVEAWNVASNLFRSITETERWRRCSERRELQIARDSSCLNSDYGLEDKIGKEFMHDVLNKYFRAVDDNLKKLEKIPEEFRLVEPHDPQDVMTERLMRLVGCEAMHLVDLVAA